MSERIAAARNIRIMAVSAQTVIKGNRDAIVSALRDKAASIQVLLARPNSKFVKDVERVESPTRSGHISNEILQTKALLEEYLIKAKESADSSVNIGTVEVRHYSSHLRASILVCDDQWCWYTPNLPPKRSIETFSLELAPAASGLINDCISHFDRVWDLMGRKEGS